MRRLDLLITEARRESDNLDFSDTSGIQDSEFIRWANSGQTRLVSLIQQQFPQIFQKVAILQAVVGQETYEIPSDVFLDTRIDQVEFSYNGQENDYRRMQQGVLPERLNGNPAIPSFYIRRSKDLLMQPKPSNNGLFRITYQRKLPRLDIRRGAVAAVTLDVVNRTITNLTLDATVDLDATTLVAEQYLTVVDAYGTIQMQQIPITAVSSATGVVTVAPGFVYQVGETISIGNYVCAGPYSTTNSQLVEEAERYLVEFMIWKAEKRDSNDDSVQNNAELDAIAQDIVMSYQMPSNDVSYVPFLDGQYAIFDWN